MIAIKPGPNGGRKLILDGGKNITIPLGYELHEVLPASKMNSPYGASTNSTARCATPATSSCCGSACPTEPGDVVCDHGCRRLFHPQPDELLEPRPAVVMAHDGTAELIRAREQFEDIVRLDQFVD